MALLCGMWGCSKEVEEEVNTAEEAVKFTLTASYGPEDSKVAFNEDGLTMTWQPGDCLYLIDVAGVNSTVTMTTAITEPSKTASFTSKTSVLSGEYVVLYGQNTLYVDKTVDMTSIANLNDQIRLYGALTVEDGQTSAEITLSQLFAMLTFKFKNLPGGLTDMMLGVAASETGTPTFSYGRISQAGLSTQSSYVHRVKFSWNNGAEGKSFIAPIDFTGKTLYFFIYGTDADGKHVTYEFVKSGKNLSAGTNYNMTFDFNQATSVCTLGKSTVNSGAYVLTTPEHFRAASYWDKSSCTYSLEADVDFSGKVYFPIAANMLYGNDHTLSNISVNMERVNRVGVLSSGWASNITVKNSAFKGKDYVGSIAGYCSSDYDISECTGDGITIQGASNVGGLWGSCNCKSMSKCSVTGFSSITGTGSHVGGITGYGPNNFSSCFLDGEISVSGGDYTGGINGEDGICSYCIINGEISVSGGNYTGGIDGKSRGCSNCLAKGEISICGNDYTGGIAGYCYNSLTQCGFEGTVTGAQYTGGLVGAGRVVGSYMYGDVTGTEYVGGLSGYHNDYYHCVNSYHIGNTTGTGDDVGGIAGRNSYSISYTPYNCYSYGTTSSGYGISRFLASGFYTKNLTSEPYLAYNISNDNCNCGPEKTFLSKLSVINGDEAYSTQVWKNIDAQCPLLQWQADLLNGNIEIPGFDEEDW